jgi:hypothetical protein
MSWANHDLPSFGIVWHHLPSFGIVWHRLPITLILNVVPLHSKTREQASAQQRASSLHSPCTVPAFETREQAAAQQFERAQLHSPCTVLASSNGGTRPGYERYASRLRAAIRRPMNAKQTGCERNADGLRVKPSDTESFLSLLLTF